MQFLKKLFTKNANQTIIPFITLDIKHDLVWRLEEESDQNMQIIGMLLASDIGWDPCDVFSQSLYDDTIYKLEGNFSVIMKDNDNAIINGKYVKDFYKTAFTLPKKDLHDLILNWIAMCKEHSTKLTGAHITYENNNFVLQPLLKKNT